MKSRISAEMQIWPIEKLNYSVTNDADVEHTCANIREFGFRIPCLVTNDGEVIDGQLRVEAARRLGFREIPVFVCDGWPADQVNAFRRFVKATADGNEELTREMPGDSKTAYSETIALVRSQVLSSRENPEKQGKGYGAPPAAQFQSAQISGHGAKFPRRKEQAIAALLLVKGNVTEAARLVGIGTQTLYRWTKNREFDAEYRAAKRAVVGEAVAILRDGMGAAAVTMLNIMEDPGASASTRLRASDLVLRHSTRAIEQEDTDARLLEAESNRRFDAEVARVEALNFQLD